MAQGAILVDHTTASADVARELHGAARQRGIDFIDAPVSGGQAGARTASSPSCAAATQRRSRRGSRWRCVLRQGDHALGRSGAGQLTKMVNQICIAGLVQGLAEALAFGQRAGPRHGGA